jgi:hypothetical protein
MEKNITITAISGWAIPETWFAEQLKFAFPNSQLKIIYPENPASREEAKNILRLFPSQLYIGYSLGSLWLLKYQSFLPQNCRKAIISPILAFLDQGNLGGKTSESNLKYLIKLLTRCSNYEEVLRKFFFDAKLPYPEEHAHEIRDRKILIKGLEFLKDSSATGKETNEFISIIGKDDAFVDAEVLKSHIPHLKIIKGAGHSPIPLLNKLAKYILADDN